MIAFLSGMFGFVNDLLTIPFPGLDVSFGTFVYGVIAINISLYVLARLLNLHQGDNND